MPLMTRGMQENVFSSCLCLPLRLLLICLFCIRRPHPSRSKVYRHACFFLAPPQTLDNKNSCAPARPPLARPGAFPPPSFAFPLPLAFAAAWLSCEPAGDPPFRCVGTHLPPSPLRLFVQRVLFVCDSSFAPQRRRASQRPAPLRVPHPPLSLSSLFPAHFSSPIPSSLLTPPRPCVLRPLPNAHRAPSPLSGPLFAGRTQTIVRPAGGTTSALLGPARRRRFWGGGSRGSRGKSLRPRTKHSTRAFHYVCGPFVLPYMCFPFCVAHAQPPSPLLLAL